MLSLVEYEKSFITSGPDDPLFMAWPMYIFLSQILTGVDYGWVAWTNHNLCLLVFSDITNLLKNIEL